MNENTWIHLKVPYGPSLAVLIRFILHSFPHFVLLLRGQFLGPAGTPLLPKWLQWLNMVYCIRCGCPRVSLHIENLRWKTYTAEEPSILFLPFPNLRFMLKRKSFFSFFSSYYRRNRIITYVGSFEPPLIRFRVEIIGNNVFHQVGAGYSF